MTRRLSAHRRPVIGGRTYVWLLVSVVTQGAFATASAQLRSTAGPLPSVEARSANAVADGPTNVWDGVYTQEQIEKGRVTYDRACSSCHKDDMSGDVKKFAPPLAGPAFTSRWNGRPLSDLYLKVAKEQKMITMTMMRPREINETLTYILKGNGMPAGPMALSENFPDLELILFTATPPRVEAK